MDEAELADVVDQVRALVEAHYVFPEVAAGIAAAEPEPLWILRTIRLSPGTS